LTEGLFDISVSPLYKEGGNGDLKLANFEKVKDSQIDNDKLNPESGLAIIKEEAKESSYFHGS
jgi:hypothetical protein